MKNKQENNNSSISSSTSSSSLAPCDFNVNSNDSQSVEDLLSHDDDQNQFKSTDPLLLTSDPSLQLPETFISLIPTDDLKNIDKCDNDKPSEIAIPICPVCNLCKYSFFCANCIKNGDFTYSKGRFPERFAEKKLKYFKLKEEQLNINESINDILKNKVIKEDLEHQVNKLEFNIEYLRKIIDETQQQVAKSRTSLSKTQQNQADCCQRSAKLKEKVNSIQEYMKTKQLSLAKKNENKNRVELELKQMLKQRMTELNEFIFPVEITSGDDNNDSGPVSNSETTPLLTFSDSYNLHTNYSIVEPWLPGNGDYSAYTFQALIRKGYPSKESNYRNPEFRIGAALAYTSQLLNVLAHFLDVRLPKRLSYSEFCLDELDETHFLHKVAKLNINVIYLCLSQNVNSELLQPKTTLKNLLYLLNQDASLLGSSGSIIFGANFLEYIEDALLDDLMLVDEPENDICNLRDQDDDELTDYDWVDPNLPDVHLNFSSQSSSLAGGFMSTAAASMASIWKAATGQK